MARSRELSERDSPKTTRPIGPSVIGAAVVVMALLPIVVATIRAVTQHWIPIGDDGYFSIRAADFWSTQHFPLLGTWTSASLTMGRDINNPGPLLFDALAVPVLLFGSTTGVAVGIGLLNGAAVAGIGWIAYRQGGLVLLVPAMVVTAGLGWAMGSQLLFDPWQPHSMLLPFLCFLFLAWGIADGDLVLVPWAAATGSLIVETHLSYAYLIPVLGGVGVLGLVWRLRRRVRADAELWPSLRRRLVKVGAVTALVLVVCWLQPLMDEVNGVGNISALLDTGGAASGPTLGPTRAARVMASVLSLPPFWLRDSFATTLSPAGTFSGGPGGVGLLHVPSMARALASLIVLLVLLAGLGGFVAFRRRDHAMFSATVVSLVGLTVGYFTASRIPIGTFGAAAHTLRWLWPLGAFAGFVLLASLLRIVAGERADRAEAARGLPPGRARAFVGVGILVVVVVSALNLPSYNAAVGPAARQWAEPALRDLDRQIAAHPPKGPLLVDFSNTFFLEPYSTPIMAQLQRSGVEFVTGGSAQIRQVGPARKFDGHNARSRILYRQGRGALTTPPGERRIAFHAALTPAEQAELDDLVASGVESERRVDLQRDFDRATVGIFIAPLDGPRAKSSP